MQKEKEQSWLTCQVPSRLALAARKAAAAQNISRSEFVRRAVEAFLTQGGGRGVKDV